MKRDSLLAADPRRRVLLRAPGRAAVAGALILEVAVLGCTPTEPNQLDQLGTVRVTIKGQPFELWVADEFDEQQRGLMFVNAEQLAPLSDGTRRGMIFVFDHEQKLSFWMRNTIIPLDIAYVDSEGRVVATYTMVPLDDRLGQYQSRDPARIAIEVSAGVWRDLGLIAGDQVDIPANLLKR